MEHSRVANPEKVKNHLLIVQRWEYLILNFLGLLFRIALLQVGAEGEESDFEDLLAHLAARIKLRFGRVCYRLVIRRLHTRFKLFI